MHLGLQSRLCFKKRVKRSCFPGSSFLNSAANSMSYSFRHVLNGEWWAICLEHPHSVLLLLVPRAPAGWGIPACSQHSPSKKTVQLAVALCLPPCSWPSQTVESEAQTIPGGRSLTTRIPGGGHWSYCLEEAVCSILLFCLSTYPPSL